MFPGALSLCMAPPSCGLFGQYPGHLVVLHLLKTNIELSHSAKGIRRPQADHFIGVLGQPGYRLLGPHRQGGDEFFRLLLARRSEGRLQCGPGGHAIVSDNNQPADEYRPGQNETGLPGALRQNGQL